MAAAEVVAPAEAPPPPLSPRGCPGEAGAAPAPEPSPPPVPPALGGSPESGTSLSGIPPVESSRRPSSQHIHLSLTTEFSRLVDSERPLPVAASDFPSLRLRGVRTREGTQTHVHISLQPEFAELLGLSDDEGGGDDDAAAAAAPPEDDGDSFVSRISARSFSAQCVPIDEDLPSPRPSSAGSRSQQQRSVTIVATVSENGRAPTPESFASEILEDFGDGEWCGNWRPAHVEGAEEPPSPRRDGDEPVASPSAASVVDALRSELSRARADAADARADAATARRAARRHATASRADAAQARRSAAQASAAFDAVAEAASASAREADEARSNQAAAEAAHAASQAELRRALRGETGLFGELAGDDAISDFIKPATLAPPKPLDALLAAKRALDGRVLAAMDSDDLQEVDAILGGLRDGVRTALRERSAAIEEEIMCAVCRAEKKTVAFAKCGHCVCVACAARVSCCPFCRGPSEPLLHFRL